jgi:hypothetical protein
MLALARRIGNRRQEWFALSEMTYVLTMLGRWGEALARWAELPDEVIGRTTTLSSPLSGVVEIHIRRGELEEARRLVARYQAAAEKALRTRESLGIASQDVKVAWVRAVEAALALEDSDRLEDLLAIVDRLPVGLRPPFLSAMGHRFRARLAADDPAADRYFTAAAAELRAFDLPFHLAVVQLEHGEWLMARGRPDDAEPLLAEARETFDRLQAAPWLERANASLPSGEPEPVRA